MEFLAIVGIIVYLFILNGRVNKQKEEIGRLKSAAHTHKATASVSQQAATSPGSESQPAPAPDQVQTVMAAKNTFIPQSGQVQESSGDAFIEWLKEDILVKIGALLLLIGFGWFVSYAFANNWIGPMGRIALGLVAGVGIMALGVWRIRTRYNQGAIFSVLGSTVVLLTVFAARGIYEFFTPATALIIMFMSVVFVAYLSVQYKSEKLALAGLLLAAVAPLLTNTPEPSVMSLFSYLIVIVLGTLWVVYVTGARSLTFTSLLIIIFYSAPYLFEFMSDEDQMTGLLFAFVFTAIFFVSNVVSIMYRQDTQARQGHILTAATTGVYLITWIAFAAPTEWQSLLYIAWMMVFAVGAFAVYRHTNDKIPFYIYAAVAVGLLAAATAAIFDGALLSIAYSVEVGAIVMLASVLFMDRHVADRVSWLFLGPIFLSFEHIASLAWRDGFLHTDFFALLVLMLVLFGVGSVLYAKRTESEPDSVDASIALSVAGIMYLLSLVWLVLHAVLSSDTATMLSLFVYTVIGISLYVRGQHEETSVMQIAGGILLGLVVVRLLLVDVWQMELAGRIITFFAIGTLLISTAFMGKFGKRNDRELQ